MITLPTAIGLTAAVLATSFLSGVFGMAGGIETLRRPADPRTNDTVASAHALLKKAAAMCNEAVRNADRSPASRETFDVTETVREIRDLVAPTLPTSGTSRRPPYTHCSVPPIWCSGRSSSRPTCAPAAI